ncbi:MAG TPA: glucose-6-phosphate isomerase [Candidatus Atribacteria bacterium]|nr:MAG: glucose-6-phosphate isomerase [Candidatus Nealsonbacteria bacterium]HDK26910.1 glucose-6-phosphate isomerase [Candidatus Atribacteria bacterium]
MNYFEPFNSYIDLEEMKLNSEGELIIRKLSDMVDMFQNKKAAEEALKENPIIYKVYNVQIPEESGHLQHCISIVYPGKIGNEYYMTKGHFHKIKETSEIYLTLKGRGKLIMQMPDQKLRVLDMEEGNISYIPPYWAHRTVNIGDEPLIFFGVYRGDAGHNYGIIEEKGMSVIIVEEGDKAVIKNNLAN